MSGPLLPAAHCHALRLRFPGMTARPGQWVEDVPAPATDPLAARRRAVELARPADRPRTVLLRYADGLSDLIVVAPRGHLDRTALNRLAVGEPVEPRETASTPRVLPQAPPPVWGLGGDGPGTAHIVPLEHVGDEASWIVALAVTLRRYDPDTPPVIGTDRGSLTVEAAATPGESKPVPAAGAVLAGLLFDDSDHPAGIEAETEYVPCLEPAFPLTVSIHRDSSGLRLRCDHLGSHVSTEIAAQFVRHLVHVHRQVLHHPNAPIEDVELLDERETARVVALGRSPGSLSSGPASVPEAFARIASATPDHVAVTDSGVGLTYRELDERSDRLAHGLRARGVAAGDRVGVCLDRSAELVVTLLAVLKAGATYVPVDPAYPADRIAHAAQDAGLRVMVTRLAEAAGCMPVTPDELLHTPAESTLPTADPDDPAYVIYTSGSTGRPKGVEVPHRNVIALIDATRAEYGFGDDDVWTWFHSSAFDFSVWEIWGCLLTGGRLVVVPYFVSREPDRFRDLLVAERVTVLSQTPSAFAQLLDVDHTPIGVRLVVFGGEPLDARMLLSWFDRHPESVCRMVNMFGITETTVHVTEQTLTRKLALAATRSVGRALPGWHLYVTDPVGRLLPPGIAGEICVGGAGVARGYLGRTDLTAQRFVADPVTSGTMYRSGDLGRLRPDGSLEHLGRIDNQVKVRGFRIELDEIRSVLLEDSDVRAAAVVVRQDDPTDAATTRIDAYVILADGHGDPGAVRRRAADILPEHMLPATVTTLESLPLTTNGKLDRTKLPAPTVLHQPVRDIAPTAHVDDDLTETLTKIWTEVLGVPVGPDDDFFELGGNSLYAVRIAAALRAHDLPSVRLRELYRNPTVRGTVAGLREASP
ncbi:MULTISPECIES: amino acid adenylation domain-containing protein [Streptomyces]|uniref:Non-ribosomal peptide synthetase n=1 Tax=Streptomyces sviceus (strain ATCC 29083 / DSM 924 / JCM 4929 / NBRC 13980 / NCIMB 11184 / NRRL 5439 / UC 5370) TaxID=463191 RepID=B5HZ50_STRX2|nr:MULTISPECIES: amino acid adenylation domain-containing protein [Streptomyces]EDY58105.2 non-ribosomal peptide synthetase [Streptomyces sviceus ATCC 29083]MYT03353.1 amino acid adenylation domain-containing protein [Streptomyces sp. SID5470]